MAYYRCLASYEQMIDRVDGINDLIFSLFEDLNADLKSQFVLALWCLCNCSNDKLWNDLEQISISQSISFYRNVWLLGILRLYSFFFLWAGCDYVWDAIFVATTIYAPGFFQMQYMLMLRSLNMIVLNWSWDVHS